MKILCAEYNTQGDVAIVPVGDDVLLRNNNDFYIPEFTREVSCVPQLVVKLCKLGKGVSPRFACRYFDEIGVGIRFYADSLERELRGKELPGIVASSFDCSAAISPMLPLTARNPEFAMRVNGSVVFQGRPGDVMDGLVALASDFHMLKIGDFLFCGNRFKYSGLKPGDRLQMEMEGKMMLDFEVK